MRESREGRRRSVWPVVQVASGNFLEMYDFMVFGYYAAAIGQTFFPSGSEFASLMKALMTFGAGYLMRPLGAIVLGAYIDHNARRDRRIPVASPSVESRDRQDGGGSLAACRPRNADDDDDDRIVLHDHCVYADVWRNGAASREQPRADRDSLRRSLEFRVAAGDGRTLRPCGTASAAAGVHDDDTRDGVSGAAMAGGVAFFLAAARGGTLVVVPVRQL